MNGNSATGTKLRVGIVGCGKIADAHVEEIRNAKAAELVAVCDIEPVLADQLADRYSVPHRFYKLEDMLASEPLDVVHITTPPSSHLPITEACVRSGAHIMIEKPIAFDGEGTDRIIDAVVNAGKKLSVNYWLNFETVALRAREMVDRGELGDIVHIESWYGYDLGGAFGQALLNDADHWVHQMPGKLFQNVLDHVINRVVPLLPDGPTDVHAHAFRKRRETGVQKIDGVLDELRVYLRCGGTTAYCTFTSHVKPLENFICIYGTEGAIEVHFGLRTIRRMRGQTQPSAIGRLMPPFVIARHDWKEAWRNVREFRRHEARFFYGMGTLIDRFYDAVRGRRELPIPYAEIRRVAHLMDSINEQVYGTSRSEQMVVAGSAR
ncbi:MAG: hypothetical protein NVS9B15_06870 [Acidobacteriaceae bacterium]